MLYTALPLREVVLKLSAKPAWGCLGAILAHLGRQLRPTYNLPELFWISVAFAYTEEYRFPWLFHRGIALEYQPWSPWDYPDPSLAYLQEMVLHAGSLGNERLLDPDAMRGKRKQASLPPHPELFAFSCKALCV